MIGAWSEELLLELEDLYRFHSRSYGRPIFAREGNDLSAVTIVNEGLTEIVPESELSRQIWVE